MDQGSPGQASNSSTDDFHDQIFPVHLFHNDIEDDEPKACAYGITENPQNWTNEYYVQESKDFSLEQIKDLESVGQRNHWNDNSVIRKHHDFKGIIEEDDLKR